mgnify:FL=1|tara:strand:+ start:142 stop:396 length:255 start_codon:yes stop_codon:yes gene_type:complete
MTRKTLDQEARPHTTPAEADQIESAARRRQGQMLPGKGPQAPDRDTAVDHFKGGDKIILGGQPEAASYTADPEQTGDDETEPDS